MHFMQRIPNKRLLQWAAKCSAAQRQQYRQTEQGVEGCRGSNLGSHVHDTAIHQRRRVLFVIQKKRKVREDLTRHRYRTDRRIVSMGTPVQARRMNRSWKEDTGASRSLLEGLLV
jgi:hypothetical protein